jgi:hypothetical protein
MAAPLSSNCIIRRLNSKKKARKKKKKRMCYVEIHLSIYGLESAAKPSAESA